MSTVTLELSDDLAAAINANPELQARAAALIARHFPMDDAGGPNSIEEVDPTELPSSGTSETPYDRMRKIDREHDERLRSRAWRSEAA